MHCAILRQFDSQRRGPMRKMTLPFATAAAAALLALAAMNFAQSRAAAPAAPAYASNYGEDRAQIEDLQARYLFALDFHDPDLYVSTFTEDGILDYGNGDVKG